MTKFTPGPWRMSDTGEDDPDGILSGPAILAHATLIGYVGTRANATLIVSAPDLYEALQNAVDSDTHDYRCDGPVCECWLRQARDVLAKARGEQ